MYLSCFISAFFAMCMIAVTGAENECRSFTVSISQKDFVRNENISLLCSYNITPVAIEWDGSDNDAETGFERVYNAYPNVPEASGPVSAYLTGFDGTIQPGIGHLLTVINASEDNLMTGKFLFWKCTVYATQDCADSALNVNDTEPIRYASASFHRFGILADSMEVYVNPLIKLSKNAFDLTFYAVSDPRSELSVTGIDISGGQTCSRVDGDLTPPWNCSISATVTESVNISYTVSYMGVPQKTRPLSIVFDENDDGNGTGHGDCKCDPTESPPKYGAGGIPRLEKVLIIVSFCLAVSF